MKESAMLLAPVFLPIVWGLALLVKKPKKRAWMVGYVAAGLFLTAAAVCKVLWAGEVSCTLFHLTNALPVYFKVDTIGRFMAGLVSIVWVLAGIYAFVYMRHEHKNERYFGFYLIVYGILLGLDFSGNLITFYIFYELMTLLSLPLVLHSQTHEAVMAGLKYLFYSFCGAYMVLFGFYFVNQYSTTLSFQWGSGVLDPAKVQGHETLLLVSAFFMILGFGVKAGMFPLHGWLTSAHPVAPAPASAVLSGLIVKGGVLGMIRVVYYVFGPAFLRGTWVQTVWLVLTLITVFMGSMLAYREKVLKKRLAYSTVSQISYILFGLAVCSPVAFEGALLHVAAHALIKSGLFLCAGALIFVTGKTKVDEFRGIGKTMPLILGCYTILSLGLIGIPPTGGFVSKWYLCMGALESSLKGFAWIGPVVLLVSALLTAGYLLPLAIQGFLPGEEEVPEGSVKDAAETMNKGEDTAAEAAVERGSDSLTLRMKRQEPMAMALPILVLTVLVLLLGMFPGPVRSLIESIGLNW